MDGSLRRRNNSATKLGSPRTMAFLHKRLWSTLTHMGGTRYWIQWIRSILPHYRSTLFYFQTDQPWIVLTIDDGLARGDRQDSWLPQVLSVLQNLNATATFFLCSEYSWKTGVQQLVQAGHEVGHHMARDPDVGFLYATMDSVTFETEFMAVQQTLQDYNSDSKVDWFRAPQGVWTPTMQRIVEEQQMRHVLGDCYCDDWTLANVDPEFCIGILLQQVQPGSIAILHMPQHNFREGTLKVLEGFLQGLTSRGYECVSLKEACRRCNDV